MSAGQPSNFDTATFGQLCQSLADSSPQVAQALLGDMKRRFKTLPPIVASILPGFYRNEDQAGILNQDGFAWSNFIAAVAGSISFAQLRNPAASGSRIEVTDVYLASSVAFTAKMLTDFNPTGPQLGVVAGATRLFPAVVQPAQVAAYSDGTQVANCPGGPLCSLRAAGNTEIHLGGGDGLVCVLPPDSSLYIQTGVVNTDLTVSLRWREIAQ